MSANLTLEQLELLNDSFWFAYILKFTEKTNNILIKSYISNFMLFFAPVYANELVAAKLGIINPNTSMTRKELKDIRINNIKLLPTESTKNIKRKMKEMGIDFEHYVFDMTILCDDKKELYDTNFRMWEYRIDNDEKFAKLNNIVNTPLTWTKRFLGEHYEDLFNTLDSLSDEYVKRLEKFSFNIYSYPSCKLFNDTISVDEKIYIMQRYGLVKTIMWLQNVFQEKISLEIGDIEFDFERFLLKITAVVIEIIGNDRNNCDYSIIKELQRINSKTIDDNFFRINRKIRDNIHYNRINEIKEEEKVLIKKYQDIYLRNLISIFDSKITIKFSIGYRIALALAKLEYWSRNERDKTI